MLDKQIITANVTAALAEDLGSNDALANYSTTQNSADITANLIPASEHVIARLITREDCVLAGSAWAVETFAQLDPNVTITWFAQDGDKVSADSPICEISGSARAILTGERTAMNFLQTLSSTATLVAECVAELAGSNTKLLDTRKTLPGLRMAQKYAVTCGGGVNHRIGLFDAFLIKENHIMACGSINAAVTQAKHLAPGKPVEVEVENIDELNQALDAGADIIMLDNFSLEDIRKAVSLNQGRSKLEVSGNITKARLRELADTQVDFISSGALTKHIQAIDLSLRVIERRVN